MADHHRVAHQHSAVHANTPYDAVKDFTHVTLLAENFGQVLVVQPVAAGEDRAGTGRAGAQGSRASSPTVRPGIGTASHIPAEVMIVADGIDILKVPYTGTPAAMTDLLGGHIDMFFVGTQIALPHVQEAQAARARGHRARSAGRACPTCRPCRRQGFKDFNIVNWFGAVAAGGRAARDRARLHAEIVRRSRSPRCRQQFDTLGPARRVG